MLAHSTRSIALAGAILLAGGLSPLAAIAQDATPVASPVATPGVIADEPAEIDCEGDAAPKPAMGYVIENGSSTVRYKVDEVLAGKGDFTAIGETQAFIGQLIFDEAGMPLPCSRFDADLRTLKSDSSRRDNYLQGNTLQTATYPLATFVLTGVEGLDTPLADGEEATFSMVGNFTVHGVTRQVRWDATATRTSDALNGKAVTQFLMPQFGIVPPKVGPVLEIEELVTLEVEIAATRPSQ
jgi:polyisoprenoid-binding protein YceI